MSKLMSVLGIILLAIGVALALVGFVNPDRIPSQLLLQGFLQTATLLIVGGIISIGLGGMIGALGGRVPAMTPAVAEIIVEAPVIVAPPEPAPKPITPAENRLRFPGFGRKAQETPAAAEEPPITPAVKETIDALEQAKNNLTKAMAGVDGEPAAESELYVVEDKVIRGRPARILSDGTVEAETEEGWMRFENLEHLDEYLDAMAPSQKV